MALLVARPTLRSSDKQLIQIPFMMHEIVLSPKCRLRFIVMWLGERSATEERFCPGHPDGLTNVCVC